MPKSPATVMVNGKETEIEWKPPFLTEITDVLKSGKNELEIRVANLWGNRFIGDEQYPDDIGFSPSNGLLSQLPKWFVENTPRPQQGRKTFTTCRYYDKDDPLKWVTAEYTKAIEDFIRQDPSQYWWLHRRWKHRPKEEMPAKQNKETPEKIKNV